MDDYYGSHKTLFLSTLVSPLYSVVRNPLFACQHNGLIMTTGAHKSRFLSMFTRDRNLHRLKHSIPPVVVSGKRD